MLLSLDDNAVEFNAKYESELSNPNTFAFSLKDVMLASENNERMIVKIEVSKGVFIYVVQIAGLIARRIKCDLTENESVTITFFSVPDPNKETQFSFLSSVWFARPTHAILLRHPEWV